AVHLLRNVVEYLQIRAVGGERAARQTQRQQRGKDHLLHDFSLRRRPISKTARASRSVQPLRNPVDFKVSTRSRGAQLAGNTRGTREWMCRVSSVQYALPGSRR